MKPSKPLPSPRPARPAALNASGPVSPEPAVPSPKPLGMNARGPRPPAKVGPPAKAAPRIRARESLPVLPEPK